jgi:patatin-related protein
MAPVEQQPEINATQEIRFAVVMYGGISLAIYMNGVAQELRKMVRATAPHADDGQRAALADSDLGPNDTEAVYRKLGRMLARGELTRELGEVESGNEPIRTRFVIDILSGSSAGGINAVYLAKALANDQPMDELKNLWTTEGDIGVLINDKHSVNGTRLAAQVPPRSLLNGERMYWKLLDALDGMDAAHRNKGIPRARNVEELDLYVTATDMAGQAVKLQLADKLIEEYRHRNVFHFRDEGDDNNDFLAANNPFLAFAARCTSAHPAAFEPMRLGDVDEVLSRHSSYTNKPEVRAGSPRWRRFFKEYLRPRDGDPDQGAKEFLKRDFNDGGVLDNRPFGHATDAMPLHRAEVPVSRKLVYLDPAPERLRERFEQSTRPNIAENVWLSLSTLPRYEPIRKDLRRVLERNRLIERVNVIVEGMEERDFFYAYDEDTSNERMASVERQARYTDEDWDRTTMSEMVKKRGLAWASYQHLRVTEVTDDLALLITRVAGLDDDSDEFRAVRNLVRCWRERHFDPDGEEDKLTEHAFLRRFDVKWRLRRFKFVLRRIDQMLGPLERARELVKQATELDLGDRLASDEFRRALLVIRTKLDEIQTDLHKSREHLWEDREDHPLREPIGEMNIEAIDLEDLLEPQTAQEVVAEKEAQFEQFRRLVEGHVGATLKAASEKSNKVLSQPSPDGLLDADGSDKEIARHAVRFYYDDFANYDMISHPILYSTGVGEELARIDVFRISPEDACFLIPDKPEKPKLAGTKLNNFGAFFEENIRTNDIRWGRLDGAERIITALLPNKEDESTREELIAEAHRRILDADVFSKITEEVPTPAAKSQPGMAAADTLERFRDKYNREYETTRRFDSQRTMRSAARASRVFGDILEGYAETQRRLPKGGVVWVTRTAQLFWLMVEVAVPDSLAGLLVRHWLKLLYVFEVLAILLGTLLLYPTVQQFGFVAFVATAVVHATVLLLEDAMSKKRDEDEEPDHKRQRGKERWWRIARFVLASLIALASVLGLILVFAALGLDMPRRFVELMTGLSRTASNATTTGGTSPETAGNAPGTIARGAIILAIVAVFLLAIGKGTWKRLKG